MRSNKTSKDYSMPITYAEMMIFLTLKYIRSLVANMYNNVIYSSLKLEIKFVTWKILSIWEEADFCPGADLGFSPGGVVAFQKVQKSFINFVDLFFSSCPNCFNMVKIRGGSRIFSFSQGGTDFQKIFEKFDDLFLGRPNWFSEH